MFKKSIVIIIAAVLMLSITACGASRNEQSADSSPRAATGAQSITEKNEFKEDKIEDIESAKSVSVEQVSRKVFYNSEYDVQTKDYDKTINDLNILIEQTKSYIERSYSNGNVKDGNKRTTYVIRVPSGDYGGFKDSIFELGNIVSSSEEAQDVTGDYFDKESRIKVLKAQEERVIELLQKAENIEDILKIEAELTRIRAEIEQLTTVIKRYDDLISYSTITISIHQTSDYIVNDDSFLSKLQQTINSSLKTGLNLLKNLVYGIVWILPYLIVLTIIFFIVRKAMKNKSKNENQTIKSKKDEHIE